MDQALIIEVKVIGSQSTVILSDCGSVANKNDIKNCYATCLDTDQSSSVVLKNRPIISLRFEDVDSTPLPLPAFKIVEVQSVLFNNKTNAVSSGTFV